MDFTKSLIEVAKNRQNFKTWEENQQDNKAQREALYKKRQHSEAEIAQAKQLGERIVDVVDIMDNHSENVAENVETATQPLVGFVPLVPLVGGGYYYVKNVADANRKKIWAVERKFFETPETSQLAQKITNNIRDARPTAEGFYSWHFKSKSAIDKIKDTELRKQAMELYNQFKKETASFRKSNKIGLLAVLGGYLATFVGVNIYAAKLQVDSSRIARYQARKILEDPKAFVNYTPEQIAEAKKYVKEHPELKKEKKKEKLKSGMVKNIINVLRDRGAYKRAKKTDTDTSKKVARALSPEEIIQAKKDQEVIQRSVRLINNEAEKYSENMEVAANVIMGATPVVGGLVGWVTSILMNKTGLSDKIVSNIVKKHGSEEAKEAFQKFSEFKPKSPGYSVTWGKFVGKLMQRDYKPRDFDAAGNEIISNPKAGKGLKFAMLSVKLKKALAAAMSHHWMNSKLIGLAAGLLSAIPAALIALKLQKASARAGRYTAKRELEKDPRNFIGYTEEDMKEVKEVKGKQRTFGEKFKEYALFIPNVMKQYYAYQKYKKGEFKDHQILLDQLQKSEVNETQLKDAKNLQRKLFNTFEKVDDNSQTYSESMEAAIQIIQPAVGALGSLTMLSPFIYAGVQISRGKMTATSVLNKVTGFMAKTSNFLKTGIFKGYLKDVAKAVPHKTGNIQLDAKPLAHIFQDIKTSDELRDVILKLIANVRKTSDVIRKMDNYEQCKVIKSLEDYIKNVTKVYSFKHPIVDDYLGLLKRLRSEHFDPHSRANMIAGALADNKTIDLMSDKVFERTVSDLADFGLFSKEEAATLNKIEISDKMRLKNRELVDFLSEKEVFGAKLSEFSALIKIFAKMADAEAGAKAIKLNKGMGVITPPQGAAISDDVVKGTWETLFDRICNPKEFITGLQKTVVGMNESEFAAYADKFHFGSMDKKTFLEILLKFEKIMNNIPAAELKQIRAALLKEMKEHPDEFMKLVTSGGIKNIFLTNSLVAAASAVGISWITLNILVTWAIETWLADMQLKAGRLGVMKAIESLQDPAYYANIEVDEKSQPKAPSKQVASPATPATGSLLDKFKK